VVAAPPSVATQGAKKRKKGPEKGQKGQDIASMYRCDRNLDF